MTEQASPTAPPAQAAGRPTRRRNRLRDRRDRMLLTRYARTGDPRLREDLVERFLPLARSLAWRYQSSGEPIEDLVQVASEGLLRAIDGFDPERRVRFSSYATPMILGALRHHFRDATQAVHVPRGLGERIQQVRNACDRIGADPQSAETVPRLVALTNLDEAEVIEALEADSGRRTLSVDRLVRGADDAESPPLLETLGEEDPSFDAVEASIAAENVDLDERERRVLDLRYRGDLSQRKVGEKLGVSQMQVSRVQRKALGKLLDAVRGRRPAADRQPAPEGGPKG